MDVIVPYTRLRPEVLAALDTTGHPYETVDVSDSDSAYWELLHEMWAAGQTFCIVEHDIIVEPDTLTRLEECPQEWCASPYPYFNGHYPGLGCAKFTGSLCQRWPSVIAEIGQWSDPTHPAKHWCRLDGWIHNVLAQKARLTVCANHPQVVHRRDDPDDLWPAHGCI